MATRELKVTAPKAGENGRELSVVIVAPENMDEATEEYGAPFVFAVFNRGLNIAAQAAVRLNLEKEDDNRMSDKAVVEAASTWKMELRKPADKKATVAKGFNALSKEEQAALIAEWQAKKS